MSTTENKDTVKRFLEAFGNNDLEQVRMVMHEDVRWWAPPVLEARGIPRPMDGWDNIPWLGGGGSKTFRPGTTTWRIHHLTAEDDRVAVHMNREAVGANGKPYDNEYHWLFRLDGPMIVEVWEILDTAFAFELLQPAPAAEG
jgi:ketosteroid isomerase-like protein